MIIVIQCAGKKNKNCGYFIENDQRIMFVADPAKGTPVDNLIYKKPNDIANSGLTYRKEIENYNRLPDNPMNLCRAIDLYCNKVYKELDTYCKNSGDKLYILSAGWGLVESEFRLPNYDITFSRQQNVPKYKQRDLNIGENKDFNRIGEPVGEEIHFFGGKVYLAFLYPKLEKINYKKIIHHAATITEKLDYEYIQYQCGKNYRNWYYKAARNKIIVP